MAKRQNDPVTQLAEKLFVATWQPNGTRNDQHIATLCLDAAESFYAAVEISERTDTAATAA